MDEYRFPKGSNTTSTRDVGLAGMRAIFGLCRGLSIRFIVTGLLGSNYVVAAVISLRQSLVSFYDRSYRHGGDKT
ncbi:MAG: hypothetical protein LQ348_002616 [Seirophora lacunosa]|nr:MAG: hypothetical protein LQ348_002616 [Seirophora lacunosa]